MNSVMGPSFKKKLLNEGTCESRERYTGPAKKTFAGKHAKCTSQIEAKRAFRFGL